MKKALLQLHIAVFLAGFTAILGNTITLNEGVLVWYRMVITFATLGLILFYKKQFVKINGTNVFKLMGVGAIIAVHWVAFYGSIKYGNVSIALVCLGAIGFFTAVLEPLIFKRKFNGIDVVLGIMALLGIAIIFNFHQQFKLGVIFGIVSALGGALFPILNKQLLQQFNARTLTFYEMGGGFLLLTLLLPLYLHQFPAAYYLPTFKDSMGLLILSWLCTIIAMNFQLNALQKISAFTANLTYNLEPVYGIVLAFLIFDDQKYLNRNFYVGLSFILLSVVLQMVRVYLLSQKTTEK
jgi:drug/metabolite transporter (DMT)-like permease